ncbi:hypothetical protein Ptr902_07231 [Pyrenophora tritici-repentis]|nr:hypothetical protein Ptr902_07231 [Pyrenophora tritici-repentis]
MLRVMSLCRIHLATPALAVMLVNSVESSWIRRLEFIAAFDGAVGFDRVEIGPASPSDTLHQPFSSPYNQSTWIQDIV